MKKFITYILFTLGVLINIIAQNTTAQSILDKAAAKVQSSKGISVSFSLTQKDKLKRVVSETSGYIKIKNKKFYIKQGENETFSDGIHIWNFNGEDEVTVTKANDADDDLSPQQIIIGFNKKDFNIKLVSSNGTNYQVQLTPVDKRKSYTQVLLYINKSSDLVSKSIITDKANTQTEISFTNLSVNASIPDSQFVFDASKHPGVEIVNQ